MDKKRLTFKAFYEIFILNKTPLNQIESINQLFFGSRLERKMSDSSVSKLLKDSFVLTGKHCIYQKYLRNDNHNLKVQFLQGMHLENVPTTGHALIRMLEDYSLSDEITNKLLKENDSYKRLIELLDYALIQTCSKGNRTASEEHLTHEHRIYKKSNHCLMELQESLHNKDANVSLNHMKEPINWFLHLLIENSGHDLHMLTDRAQKVMEQQKQKLDTSVYPPYPLNTSNVQDICKHMGVSLATILYCYENRTLIAESPELLGTLCGIHEVPVHVSSVLQQDSEQSLSFSVDEPCIKNIMGEYYCYFSSTNSRETKDRKKTYSGNKSEDDSNKELNELFTNDHIYGGILTIKESEDPLDKRCYASVRFTVDPRTSFIKEYHGTVAVSESKQAIFIQLQSEVQAEMTFLILEYPSKTQMHRAFGFVLTISSRTGHRKPCVERIFVSQDKYEYDSKPYQIMKANLMMHDKFIRIDTTGYNEVIKELKKANTDDTDAIVKNYPTLDSIGPINIVERKELAYIRDTHILNLANLTDKQRIIFETSLRLHSIAPWYMKTHSKKVWLLMEEFISD